MMGVYDKRPKATRIRTEWFDETAGGGTRPLRFWRIAGKEMTRRRVTRRQTQKMRETINEIERNWDHGTYR